MPAPGMTADRLNFSDIGLVLGWRLKARGRSRMRGGSLVFFITVSPIAERPVRRSPRSNGAIRVLRWELEDSKPADSERSNRGSEASGPAEMLDQQLGQNPHLTRRMHAWRTHNEDPPLGKREPGHHGHERAGGGV